MSADHVLALRAYEGKPINVGAFTSTNQGQSEIACRAVGPIKTPDGEPFSEFIRKALIDELKMANVYSQASNITLTGNLDAIDFSSASGSWDMTLTVKSSNGKSMTVTENYSYKSSWYGETACNQTAQALMPAIQDLVGKLISSKEFETLVSL